MERECDKCCHEYIESDRRTCRCDIDNENVTKREKRCDAFSRNKDEIIIG